MFCAIFVVQCAPQYLFILIYLFSVNWFWILITNACTLYRHAKLHCIYIHYMYTNNSRILCNLRYLLVYYLKEKNPNFLRLKIHLKYFKSCISVQAKIWDKIYTCMYQVLIFDTQSRCLVICFNCLCFACLFWF